MVKLGNGGRVITVASANAVIAGSSAAAYCASKAGAAMMTRCLAQVFYNFFNRSNFTGFGSLWYHSKLCRPWSDGYCFDG